MDWPNQIDNGSNEEGAHNSAEAHQASLSSSQVSSHENLN